MNVQLVTVVNGNQEYIELFGNESLSLNISFAEIQDITKKNSAFTQEFNVPGTNQNNYIFNYFFDFNQVPLDWIPTQKFEAWLTYNGYVIMAGYVRLNFVTIDKEVKTYNVTFYNGVGDVAASIGDKFMRQLDLSSLSHPWTIDVPYYSQYDPNLIKLTGGTDYSYETGKTFWGLFNIGYLYSNSIEGGGYYDWYYFTGNTSISITSGEKTVPTYVQVTDGVTTATVFQSIYEIGDTIKIIDTITGYYVEGTVVSFPSSGFLTFRAEYGLGTGNLTNWYAQRILPENSSINNIATPLLGFTPIDANYFNTVPPPIYFDGGITFDPENTPAIRSFYPKPAIQVKELYNQIFNQAGYTVESNFFNTSYFEKYYLPVKSNADDLFLTQALTPCYTFTATSLTLFAGPGVQYLNPSTNIVCNNIPFSSDTTTIYLPSYYYGTMKWKFSWTQKNTAVCAAPPTPYLYFVWCDAVDPSCNIIISGQSVCAEELNEVTFEIPVPASKKIQFGFVGDQVIVSGITGQILEATKLLTTGGTIDYSLEFPANDFKQIEFIQSVNKLFNLIVVPNPEKQNTLIVEPIIDYIGKGQTLDWTDKIDWDSPIQVAPTTNILNGTLNYNFRLDQDFVNQQFNIENNRVFGTYQLQLNTEYKDNVINFDSVFASPTDYQILNSTGEVQLTVPSMFAIKTKDEKSQSNLKQEPFKILPRLVFRGTQLPSENWGTLLTSQDGWRYENNLMKTFQSVNRLNTYPFSYTGFSHYINYNAEDFFYTDEFVPQLQQDMYDIYYYDYISDITSPENKIISAKIYLTPWEISNLRFNEKIIIKNGYYRINKITNYNLTEPSLCDIELIKLTKSYTPHPVMYYKLVSCNPSADILYSNSDLNFNLFAFIGRYVKIYDDNENYLGCYEVQQDVERGDVSYNHYYIGLGAEKTDAVTPNPAGGFFDASKVQVFADCDCTIYTGLTIVQQSYPEPTAEPVVTPTVTPTITPSPVTPTPTPTVTRTPTVTPTNTLTPTITSTSTLTPSVTVTTTPTATLPDGNYILQEDSGLLLQEDGFALLLDIPGPTPTPTVTATVTPTTTITPTITVTPTLTMTPTASPAPAFDSDAAAYLAAVVANGGSVDATASAATNTLFTELKSNSLYTKLKVMYPMLGGVANSVKFNALNPLDTNGAFRMTYVGSPTFNASGMTVANADLSATIYANTYFNCSTQFGSNSLTSGIYFVNLRASSFNTFWFGAYEGGAPERFLSIEWTGSVNDGEIFSRTNKITQSISYTNIKGQYTLGNDGTNNYFRYNGASVGTNTDSTTRPNANIFLGVLNLGGTPYRGANAQYSFFYVSDYLNSSEAATMETLINNFQTSLGRNTY